MGQKSIIIIGAGIAGLSAGCYGQMNGYHTQIFELHDKPGGLCTSWKRKGYTIDGCLDWLVGSSPANNCYRIWEELGGVQGRHMINHEEFVRIEDTDGRAYVVYTDIDRLKKHMQELAPADKEVIEEFIKGVRTCTQIDLPIGATDLNDPADGLSMLSRMSPFLRLMGKWKGVSVQDFARQFSNPLLRRTFPLVFGDSLDFPVIAIMMTIAWMHQKSAGFPEGGSLEFSRAIERRYLELEGEINYCTRVSKILVENDRAIGAQLSDGSRHCADYIISAADGHSTIFDMLDGRYINDKILGYYDKLPLFPPLIQVALGVARPFEGLPHSVIYLLEKPVTIAGEEQRWGRVRIYNFDPTLSPPGKTVLKVLFRANYDYWKRLKQDPERYKKEKEQIADQVITLLDHRFPGIAGQVEMYDVATPMTWEQYTGNWRSSWEGWLITTKTLLMRMSKTLPALRNFYMAGQWVEPGGGVPLAAISGRKAIQIICKQDKKSFITNIP